MAKKIIDFKRKPLKRLTTVLHKNKNFKSLTFTKNYSYAIKALEHGYINAKKIEVCRVFFRRAATAGVKKMKKLKETRILIRTFVEKKFTKKSLHQRMGKGKGSVKGKIFCVHPGKVLFESKLGFIKDYLDAFKKIKDRLPFKVALYYRKSNTLFFRKFYEKK